MWKTRERSRISARASHGRVGQLCRISGQPALPDGQKYLGTNTVSLLTFGVKGGFEAGTKCFNALKLFKRMVNMGDAKSLSCHPASTTHRQLTPEEQAKAGVTPEMMRLSVGIEHIDDILADLAQALNAARA